MSEDKIKRAILKMKPEDKNGLIWAVVCALYADEYGKLNVHKEWNSDTADNVRAACVNAGLPLPP